MIVQHTPNLITATYSFHGIFRLCVRTDDPKVLQHFESEYGLFVDNSPQPVDLDLAVGKFSIAPQGERRVIGEYLVAGQWIYAAQHYKIARWRFALTGLQAPTTQLYVEGGIFSLDFVQKYLVEQIMRYKISQKGYALVHAGCVSRDGLSVLFPGLGHAGKTQLALQQVLAGWQFQADDYTFVSEQGNTYCYPRRIHISDNVGTSGPASRSPLSSRHRLSMRAKKLAYWLSLGYGNLTEALRLSELVPEAIIEDAARLQAVIMLVSSVENESKPPRILDGDELLNRVMAINFLEAQPFPSLLLSAQCMDDSISVSEWWCRERDIMRRALSGVEAYEVVVPYRAQDPTAALERAGGLMEEAVSRSPALNPVPLQGDKTP
jgi:hypothetical protein